MLKVLREGKLINLEERMLPVFDFRESLFYKYNSRYVSLSANSYKADSDSNKTNSVDQTRKYREISQKTV